VGGARHLALVQLLRLLPAVHGGGLPNLEACGGGPGDGYRDAPNGGGPQGGQVPRRGGRRNQGPPGRCPGREVPGGRGRALRRRTAASLTLIAALLASTAALVVPASWTLFS